MQSKRTEADFVYSLVRSAEENIDSGYYRTVVERKPVGEKMSLSESILGTKLVPLLAEIKFTSPAEGKLRKPGDVEKIARTYERGGVSGISVLTEPKHFDGDLRYLPLVKRSVRVPVLMKDIFIDPVQIEAAADIGADAVLFIAAVFMNGLARASLEDMFARAHARGLEVLFEAHSEEEYLFALRSQADVVGINNRNLATLEVDLETSRRLLAAGAATRGKLRSAGKDKPVLSESGITSRREVEELRALGADGFLVGSAFMKSRDMEAKVRSLTGKRS